SLRERFAHDDWTDTGVRVRPRGCKPTKLDPHRLEIAWRHDRERHAVSLGTVGADHVRENPGASKAIGDWKRLRRASMFDARHRLHALDERVPKGSRLME